MASQTLTLDELQERSLRELLEGVADAEATLTVLLPSGREVVIEARPQLKPLPELKMRIPQGWKDAIYGPR